MKLKPQFTLSKKANKIAGIVLLVLSALGIATAVYLQVALAKQIWPF